jgi:hypothetical protein
MRHRSLPACTFFAVADIEKITIKTYFFSSLLVSVVRDKAALRDEQNIAENSPIRAAGQQRLIVRVFCSQANF